MANQKISPRPPSLRGGRREPQPPRECLRDPRRVGRRDPAAPRGAAVSGRLLRDDADDFVPFTNFGFALLVRDARRINECVDELRKQAHAPAGYGHERADAEPIEHIPLPHSPASVKPRSKWKKQPWRRRRWAQDGYT